MRQHKSTQQFSNASLGKEAIMSKWRRLWPLFAAILPILLVLGVACEDEEEEGGGSPAATTPGGGEVGPGVTGTEIKLGMTNDLAGTGGTPYGVITLAMEAYFDKVNQEDGGVCDRNINLIAEDDQYAPASALEKTRKLVEQDEVLGIVGALGTAAHLGAVDYLNDPNDDGDTSDGIPDLYVSTGFSGWGDVERWPWTTGYIPDYISDSRVQASYINDNLAGQSVGILYQNDAFGEDYVNGLEDELADPGLIVSRQSYEATAADVTSQVLAIRDAGAEVVFLATTPRFAAMAITAAHAQGYNPQFFMSYVNAHTTLASLIGGGSEPDKLQIGFQELDGTISTNYILSAVEDAGDPAMVEHKRIMDTFGTVPLSTLTVYGQSLAELAVETLSNACDNLNRQGLLEAAESIDGFRSSVLWPGIDITLGPDDHYAIQTLQPVQVQADGTLAELGSPISAEE